MKKFVVNLFFLILSGIVVAQSPDLFQYQAVVRDGSGNVLANQSVGIQITVIQGILPGTSVYQETFSQVTNGFGLVNISVGSGNVQSGNFTTIVWANGPYFMNVSIDPAGGSAYTDMGTVQLLSVPYALYSKTSADAFSGNYSDLTGAPADVSAFNNDAGYITNPDDADADPANEIQSLGIAGNNLSISGGNTVTLPTGTTYTAGSGINITGNSISNTAPDQTVTVTGSGATSVAGTYPNFTITSTDNNTTYSAGTGLNLTGTTFSNTAPDQTITMTGTGATAVSGTYPNFTISSTDNNSGGTVTSIATGNGITGGTITTTGTLGLTGQALALHNLATNGIISRTGAGTFIPRTITAGNGITVNNGDGIGGNPTIAANFGTTATTVAAGNHTHTGLGLPAGVNGNIQFNNSGAFGANNILVWDNVNERMGIGLNNPTGRLVVQRSATAPLDEPLFEVKDDNGQTVFVVYKDSVRIFFDDDASKSNKGTFAVSGRNTAKAFTHNYLLVRPDSTRIYTGDSLSGFGVENVGTLSQSYMFLTPLNYFIGHEAGKKINTGRFNSFIGYQSGANMQGGNYNLFIGYRSGYASNGTSYCTMLGYEAGENNTSSDNTFIGYMAGNLHETGGGNVFLGSKAGQNDTYGVQNIFIGENAGVSNNTGSQNIFMGYSSGYSNTNGNCNVMLGTQCGMNNTLGNYNTFVGYQCGKSNTEGISNVFMGYQSGNSNTTGQSNVFIGNNAGFNNIDGILNEFIGENAGYTNSSGTNNVFIGYQCGYRNTIASGNIFMGRQTGYNNTTGWGNVYLGNYAGYSNVTGENNVFLGLNAGMSSLGNNNVLLGNAANSNNVNGINNVSLGAYAGYWSAGSENVFIGTNAGYSENGSNQLYIENTSNITTPLINGDFLNNRLAVNCKALIYPLQVGTDATNGNGAFLTTGGTWTTGSSRFFKDRYTELNAKDILNKIENMELKGWFYKGTQEYHIGPFAEDFYEAFGTGVLDVEEDLGRYLSASDVAGVSFVAIQELIKQNKEQNNKTQELNKLIEDNTKLKKQVDELGATIQALNSRIEIIENQKK